MDINLPRVYCVKNNKRVTKPTFLNMRCPNNKTTTVEKDSKLLKWLKLVSRRIHNVKLIAPRPYYNRCEFSERISMKFGLHANSFVTRALFLTQYTRGRLIFTRPKLKFWIGVVRQSPLLFERKFYTKYVKCFSSTSARSRPRGLVIIICEKSRKFIIIFFMSKYCFERFFVIIFEFFA